MVPSPATDPPLRSPGLLGREQSRLLVIDMQEKLLAAMPARDDVVGGCEFLVRGAQLLGVPVAATEQYPRGLGPTVEPLRGLLGTIPEKLRFSSCSSFDWARAAGEAERPQIVIAGIEAHVCVQQTVLDLLAAGFAVYVAADAITSRRSVDLKYAIKRMRDQGAIITTAEAILFEWCETAEAAEFKALSALVKQRASVAL